MKGYARGGIYSVLYDTLPLKRVDIFSVMFYSYTRISNLHKRRTSWPHQKKLWIFSCSMHCSCRLQEHYLCYSCSARLGTPSPRLRRARRTCEQVCSFFCSCFARLRWHFRQAFSSASSVLWWCSTSPFSPLGTSPFVAIDQKEKRTCCAHYSLYSAHCSVAVLLSTACTLHYRTLKKKLAGSVQLLCWRECPLHSSDSCSQVHVRRTTTTPNKKTQATSACVFILCSRFSLFLFHLATYFSCVV